MDDAFHAYDEPHQLDSLNRWKEPTFRDVQYAVIEGYRPLLMDITVPDNASGPVPVVVCVHGGGWITGSHKPTHDDYIGYPLVWEAILSQGLAVASIQYRHGREQHFPAQLHDAKAAVRWLRRFGNEVGLDPSRIGAWGESAGGHITSLLAMNTTDPVLEGANGVVGPSSSVKAVVSWFPPTELSTLQSQMPPGATERHDQPNSMPSILLGGVPTEDLDLAAFGSPTSYVSGAAAPLLLIHGDADMLIPHAQSEVLRDALASAGGDVRLITIPGADHCFPGAERPPIAELTASELARRLRD